MFKKSIYKKENLLFIILYTLSIFFVLQGAIILFDNHFERMSNWSTYAENIDEKIEENGENYFLINTPGQLQQLFEDAKSVKTKTNYKLAKNLDMGAYNWTPKNLSNEKVSIFGNGFSIMNLKVDSSEPNVGFISCLKGTLDGLNFENISVVSNTSSSNNVGGIVGENYGTIKNCFILSGNISKNSINGNVGGIVGLNNANGKILNCSNSADVCNGYYLGGIVGKAVNGTKTKKIHFWYPTNISYGGVIVNNVNLGKVYVNKSSYRSYIGGIIGYAESKVELNNLLNKGEVSANYEYNYLYVGGIVGRTSASIQACGNNSDIKAGNSSSETVHVGGIAGYLSSANVSDCFNTGSITAKSKTYKSSDTNYVDYRGSGDKEEELRYLLDKELYLGLYNQWRKNYYYYYRGPKGNTQETIERIITYNKAYAGGIAGSLSSSSSKVKNCYSIGNVSGGKKTYKDKYAFTLYYSQYFRTAGIHGYTQYTENTVKVYFTTLEYDYEYYSSPIAGVVNGSANKNMLNNTYGVSNYLNTTKCNYIMNSYLYHDTGFLPITVLLVGVGGLVGMGLNIAGFFINDNYKGSNSTRGTIDSKKTIKINSSDNSLFSVATIGNVKQDFGISNNRLYSHAKFTCNGNNMDRILTKGEYVSLNHLFPDNDEYSNKNYEYNFKTDSILKELNKGSTLESWVRNPIINNGYPYIKTMYWG